MSGLRPTDERIAMIVRTLPAAPRILAELAPHLQRLDSDLSDVTVVLRRDAALTARLIDMANSVAYRGTESATSIEEAVARVGYRETYRLVGAVASTQLADEPLAYYGVQPRRLRQNSLFIALMLEELADVVGMDTRTAYTVGLLRSIGKVVLDRLAREYPHADPFVPDGRGLVEWEQATWGCSNVEIGAHILELWQFPKEASQTLASHYTPVDASSSMLNIAAGFAERRGFGLPGEQAYWDPERYLQLGLDADRLAWANERAYLTLNRISSVLN